MTHAAGMTPSLKDRIEDSDLPKKIQGSLMGGGIKTFRGVAVRSWYKLFDIIDHELTYVELLAFNAELAKRDVQEVWPPGLIRPGHGLPVALVDRLWKARVFLAKDVSARHSRLRELVGAENILVLLDYLRTAHQRDLTESLYWYIEEGFPEEAADRLWHYNIRTPADLATERAERLDHDLTNLPQSKKTLRDTHRTVRYARWWFVKHHSELLQKPPF